MSTTAPTLESYREWARGSGKGRDDVDSNKADNCGRTLFWWAAEDGHAGLVARVMALLQPSASAIYRQPKPYEASPSLPPPDILLIVYVLFWWPELLVAAALLLLPHPTSPSLLKSSLVVISISPFLPD